MFFQSNIRLLRERRGASQEVVSSALGIKRATLNNYENGYAQPKLELLETFSGYYNISIDNLIRVDLSKMSEFQLRELEEGYDTYIKGSKLRVLATTVDKKNKDNIELVPLKAKAGYTNGYNDPEFIEQLPVYQLPFLHQEKKYRTFQIDGDSMLPIPHGAYVTCEFITNWKEIKEGTAAIVLTKDEGVVFKIIRLKKNTKKITLESLNPAYKSYEVSLNEVKEIWKFAYFASHEIPDPHIEKDELTHSVAQLRKDVYRMMEKISSIK